MVLLYPLPEWWHKTAHGSFGGKNAVSLLFFWGFLPVLCRFLNGTKIVAVWWRFALHFGGMGVDFDTK
jgi:hypothetical protein